MASSRKPGSTDLRHHRDELAFPSRTAGSLGINDAGDPTRFSLLGDTPGPLGVNDHGSPDAPTLPGLKTFHEWLLESSVHLEPQLQTGYYYPAGDRKDVLDQAFKFLVKEEDCPLSPYVPPGRHSGITIGVGYDIGQTSEPEFRQDWPELDNISSTGNFSLGVDLNLPQPSLPGLQLSSAPAGTSFRTTLPPLTLPKSKLFSVLDRLALAAKGKLRDGQAALYLQELTDVVIPRELSLKVFRERTLPKWYARAASALPGFTGLPEGVQVAVLSILYNRGTTFSGGEAVQGDIFNSRWELRELRTAVLCKDLVWIYWSIESMRRVWVHSKDAAGLIKRRDQELQLVYPYVANDLRFEALRQRFRR